MENKELTIEQSNILKITGNGFRQLAIKTFGDDRLVGQALAVLQRTPVLKKCNIDTFIGAVIQVKALGLSLDQNIGQAYLIPYANSREGVSNVQLQIGWKGFMSIAMRDKNVKIVNAGEVKENEYKGTNQLTGEVSFEWNNTDKRDSLKTIGFVAYIELLDGRTKTLYWSIDKMNTHMKKYSKSFDTGPWKSQYEEMGKKTILKMLLTKCGLINIDCGIDRAKELDQAVIKRIDETTGELLEKEYIDNPNNTNNANKKYWAERTNGSIQQQERERQQMLDDEEVNKVQVLEEVSKIDDKNIEESLVEKALRDIK